MLYYRQFSEEIHVPHDRKQAVFEFLEELETKIASGEVDWRRGSGGIEYSFPGRDTHDGGTVFKLWAMENFLDTDLMLLVQGVLKAIGDDGPVTISFAYTCSSPIVNAFGGATWVIWQDRDELFDSNPNCG